MEPRLGIDVGATSVKAALLAAPRNRPVLQTLCGRNSRARWTETPDGTPCLLLGPFRIERAPLEIVRDLLEDLDPVLSRRPGADLRVTGSGGAAVAAVLRLVAQNELLALARMVGAHHPDVRTVIEIGGERSKVLRLRPGSEAREPELMDFALCGACAAGTGSFLDQQADRLGIRVEDLGRLANGAPRAARIAGRCAVFAETDMIHAQQRGYRPEEVLRGLCRALARSLESGLLRGRSLEPPVALAGAVAINAGVVRALREALRLHGSELVIPAEPAFCTAIGAAMDGRGAPGTTTVGVVSAGCAAPTPRPHLSPLSRRRVMRLEVPADPSQPSTKGEAIPCTLGLDVGSISTNLVALDLGGDVIHAAYLRTCGRPLEIVEEALRGLEEQWGERLDVRGVGTTGSGRELAGEYVGADLVRDEITAHRYGTVEMAARLDAPAVETIFEIGGQDAKFIAMEDGVVVDFAMNEACAAGTGSFLEAQARKLGVRIESEFSELALGAARPAALGERCTVFMERDLTTCRQAGASLPDLAAGLAYSVALNYLNRIVRSRRLGSAIYFQGGTAFNDAVAAAFAALTGRSIVIPPHHEVMGALGMALLARDRPPRGRSRFRGFDLGALPMRTRDFVCRGCTNQCDIREFTIEERRTYWGDRCSNRFRRPVPPGRQPVVEDLVALRHDLLDAASEGAWTGSSNGHGGGVRVGIPRCMTTFDHLPFWHRYLREIGATPVLSPFTDQALADRGLRLAVAEPCHPIQVAHAHADALLADGVEFLLVPNVREEVCADDCELPSSLCPWSQTLPFVLRACPALDAHAPRFLAPTLHLRLGVRHVCRQLAPVARRLGVDRRRSDRAAGAAWRAQASFTRRRLDAGRRALAALCGAGEPGLLVLGRSYNLYDRHLNCDVPAKLRARYGANVIPLDFVTTGLEPAHAASDNMYWAYGRRMLAAAAEAESSGFHIVEITNFKCGPDSFLKSFVKDVCRAPPLVLQFDGHGNDAGYLTRCEAYLESRGILG